VFHHSKAAMIIYLTDLLEEVCIERVPQ